MKINSFFDFCSGIGGGRIGAEKKGLVCVGYSDTSRLAVTTYSLMNDVSNEKNYGNIKRIKLEKLPDFDLMIAGFPCQSFSVMGRKEGFSDSRGQIIFYLIDILKYKQPSCFLLENVKGLVTHDKGKTLQTIIGELEKAGYQVQYKVLSSIDYGVPQMRNRVYIVGIRNDLADKESRYEWPEPVEKPNITSFLTYEMPISSEREEILNYYLNNKTNCGNYSVHDIKEMDGKIIDTRMSDLRIYDGRFPTLRAQRDGILYVRDGIIYQLTGYEALLLQGFPVEKAINVKDVVSDRHLLMQAGNAMTVPVIEKIIGKIIEY